MSRRPATRPAMRAVVAAAVVGCAAAAFAQDNYQVTDPNVADTFRYARMAVGGGAVAKVKTMELKGRSKVDFNGSLIDCAVDIKLLMPDHYLRIDATKTDDKLAGFAGKNVLNAIRTGDNLSLPPANITSAILKNEQARLARMLVGALTYVTPNVTMILHSAGMQGGIVDPRVSAKTTATAEGRGVPNVAEISGQNGFHATMTMDATTRMPLRLVYPNGPAEETMTFDDRRDVGGLKIPFRITTTAGGRLIDELVFETVLINPEIAKADFSNKR
jgi:hypothetical protein